MSAGVKKPPGMRVFEHCYYVVETGAPIREHSDARPQSKLWFVAMDVVFVALSWLNLSEPQRHNAHNANDRSERITELIQSRISR